MIATLSLLNKYFKNSEIVFYDIGACYGYFAVMAMVVFEKAKVIAVEGNPHSAWCIGQHEIKNRKINIQNSLMGASTGVHDYYSHAYEFQKRQIKWKNFLF